MSTAVATPIAARAQEWLAGFDQALVQGETAGGAELFGEPSFWRDLISFTWNIKTVEGREGVTDMLTERAAATDASGFQTRETPTDDGGVVSAWIEFETAVGRGVGHLRLKPNAEGDDEAWTLLTA